MPRRLVLRGAVPRMSRGDVISSDAAVAIEVGQIAAVERRQLRLRLRLRLGLGGVRR